MFYCIKIIKFKNRQKNKNKNKSYFVENVFYLQNYEIEIKQCNLNSFIPISFY